jgi:hypothetical protein
MHKLKENLKEKLYDFEEKVERNPKAEMSMQELQKVQLMSDIVKNIDKIDILEGEEGYSEDGHYMGEGRIYGTSYARGRGRNAKRDRMGRYSSDDGYSQDDMSYARGGNRGGNMGRSYRGGMSYDGAKEHLMKKAEEMLEMAHDPKERRAIEKLLDELED